MSRKLTTSPKGECGFLFFVLWLLFYVEEQIMISKCIEYIDIYNLRFISKLTVFRGRRNGEENMSVPVDDMKAPPPSPLSKVTIFLSSENVAIFFDF